METDVKAILYTKIYAFVKEHTGLGYVPALC